jgi:hypothetical protein
METFTPLMDLYLDSQLAVFQKRLENLKVGQVIENACAWIQARIRNRKGRKAAKRTTTTKEQKNS